MPNFIILAENLAMGNLSLGTWRAETAEEAVKKMKESDRTYLDAAKDQAKEDGHRFFVYEVTDYSKVRTD